MTCACASTPSSHCSKANGRKGDALGEPGRPTRSAVCQTVGTLVPIATGCAFAERYRGTDRAVLAFVGDGTTSTGDFHEALNIASVQRLPLVVVVENNQWAFGTPNRLQFAVPTLALRALAYGAGVEGYWIDGTDVIAVCATVRKALERARSNQTISIIEAVSMRHEGHSLADPFRTYVPAEQLEIWERKDPVRTFRARLINKRGIARTEVDAIDARIVDEVRSAAMEAEQGPTPNADDIESLVFVQAGPSQIVLETAPPTGSRIRYHQAIHDALRDEMDRDPSLFIIGEMRECPGEAYRFGRG